MKNLIYLVLVLLFTASSTTFAAPTARNVLPPPVLQGVPANITLTCNAPIPAPPTVTANSPTCPTATATVSYQQTISAANACGYVITRTWTATDICLQNMSQSQTITVKDAQAPVLMPVLPALSGFASGDTLVVNCSSPIVLKASDMKATDNCDGNPTVTFEDRIIQAGNCPTDGYLVKMDCSWFATDACGNVSRWDIVVLVKDTTPPTLANAPAAITVSCANIPLATPLAATDNCDGSVEVSFSETRTGANCPAALLITRVWTAKDDCGNTAQKIQKITVLDDQAPELDGVPANLTVHIDNGETVEPAPVVSAIDNCGSQPSPTVQFNETQQPDSCGYTLTRTWSATDACGNNVTKIQKIKVISGCGGNICVAPIIQGASILNAICGGNGAIQVNVAGNIADYIFTWSPNVSNTFLATGIPAGGYTVTVGRANQPTCQTTQTFILHNNNGPAATVVATTSATCDNADGSATLSPAVFSYQWSDGGTGSNRNNLRTGTYAVTVIDATRPTCINVLGVIIGGNNNLTIQAIINQKPDCGQSNGSATLSVAGGSGSYLYSWGNSPTRSNLTAGTYTVTVTDTQTGCKKTLTFGLANNVAGAIVINITSSSPIRTSCAGNDGKVDFTTTADSQIAQPISTVITDAQGNIAINGSLSPGNYCLSAKDADNCIVTVQCFIVVAAAPLLVSSLVKNKNCIETGAIQLLMISGNAGYRFDWADLAGNNDPQNRTDLAAGNYQVSIYDGAGCSVILNNIAVQNTCDPTTCSLPTVAQATILSAHCGKQDGRIVLQIASTQPLTYQWSPNVSNTNTANNLAAGVYRVTVSIVGQPDCRVENIYIVSNADAPQAMVQSTTAANCAAADGSATLLPAILNYAWSDGGTGNLRNNLPAGTYQVSITNSTDSTPCVGILSVVIGKNSPLVVTPVINKKPFCDFFNGSVTLEVAGGSGDYAFSWGSEATKDNLAAGIYTVTVTDNTTGCQQTTLFGLSNNVLNGATIFIENVAAPTCSGEADGNALIAIKYELNFIGPPAITIQDANGNLYNNGELPSGNYCLTVKNAVGCTADIQCFTIPTRAPLVVTVNTLNKTCTALGAIIPIVTGGTAPYTFDWADLSANSEPNNRLNLATGSYAFTVADSKGCNAVVSNIVIGDNCNGGGNCTPHMDTIRTTTDFDNEIVICLPKNDLCGSALLSVSICGQPTNGVLAVSPQDTCVRYVPNGNFSGSDQMCVVLCAANGVCDTSIIIVNVLPDSIIGICTPPVANAVIIASHCEKSDGSITLNLNNGNALYQFTWSPNVSTTTAAVNLAAGVYRVIISEKANPNCKIEKIYTVGNTNGPAVVTDSIGAASCTAANGYARLLPADFEYAWSGGGFGNVRNNLKAGSYQVTATDPANNCPNYLTVEIPTKNIEISLQVVVEKKPNCQQANGRVRLNATTPGGGNFAYSWGSSNVKEGLAAGVYTVTVTETATGCSQTITFSLADSVQAAATVTVDSVRTPACAGLNNGRVFFSLQKADGFIDPETVVLINSENQIVSNGNLSAGSYCLLVKNADNCVAASACFDIIAPQALVVNVATVAQTCNDLGAILVVTTGGTPSYRYNWEDLAGSNDPANRQQLAAGTYNLTVSDAKGCAANITGIVLGNDCQNPDSCVTKIDTIRVTSTEKTVTICIPKKEICSNSVSIVSLCELPNDGTLTINGTDTCVTYTLNPALAVTSDTMCVVICGASNVCDTTIIIVNILPPPPTCPVIFPQDTITLTAFNCDSTANYCLPIQLQDFSKYQITDNGFPYTGGFEGCDFDSMFSYLYFTMPGGGKSGPYQLQAWTVSGETFNGQFNNVFALLDSMRTWDPSGNWQIDTTTMTFRGGNSSNTYGTMLVKQIGTSSESAQEPNLNLLPMGIAVKLDTGTHKIIVTQIVTGCSDTLCAVVRCKTCPIIYSGPLTVFAPTCDSVAEICLNFPFFGDNIGYYNIDDNGLAFEGGFGRCLTDSMKTYVRLDTGFHLLVVFNNVTGCRDTLPFTVGCGAPPSPSLIDTTIFKDSTLVICIDTSELTAPFVSLVNICPNSANDVIYTINGNCISLVGVSVGTDTLCLVACGADGVCDTTTVIVQIIPKNNIRTDTVRLDVRLSFSDTICIDTSGLGSIGSVTNICPTLSGTNVIFDQIGATNCFIYTGESIGADTACFVICNTQGICDTTILIINVVPPTRDTVLRTVIVTQSAIFCVDTTELSPPILTFQNICPNNGSDNVNFVLSTQSPWCVTYTGTALGNDTACLVICNGLICDTTILIVTVIRDSLLTPPLAVNDTISLSFGQMGDIDVLRNDSINGVFVSFDNITMPMNGNIVKTALGFKYTPNPNFCGLDSFRYVLKNAVGSDTATVYIDIKCDTFIIFTGISPNGDGKNDKFTIIGIENYPDNRVVIYNRWGHLIFDRRGYTNADGWEGTWRGETVPDGTYFYCVGLGVKGGNKEIVGYLQIHR